MSLPFPCSQQGSILHATGAPEQGKHQINPACCWIVKISHILKLHATDLSLPCLLQGRSQHATEAPLHHSSFLSSAGFCQDTASGVRQSTRVEQGLRWMFEDTQHRDMHMSSGAGEMALVGDIILYMTTSEQHAARPKRGQQRARAMAISPRAGQGRLRDGVQIPGKKEPLSSQISST